MIDRFLYVCGCTALAIVMGAVWGGLLGWIHAPTGYVLGVLIFLFCLVGLILKGWHVRSSR